MSENEVHYIVCDSSGWGVTKEVCLGDVPEVGDSFSDCGISFQVTQVKKNSAPGMDGKILEWHEVYADIEYDALTSGGLAPFLDVGWKAYYEPGNPR